MNQIPNEEWIFSLTWRHKSQVILKLGVLPVCLDLFIKYEWHSFLHNIVESMVGTVLSGENKALKMSLFKEGNLLGRIIDATRHNDDAVTQGKNCRKGYMGQLRLIASESSPAH